jgi:hypothetical protein
MDDLRAPLRPSSGPLWAMHFRDEGADFWLLLAEVHRPSEDPLYRIVDSHVVSEPSPEVAGDEFSVAGYLTDTIGDRVVRLATEDGTERTARDFAPGRDLYWSLPDAAADIERGLHILVGTILQVGSAELYGWSVWKSRRSSNAMASPA